MPAHVDRRRDRYPEHQNILDVFNEHGVQITTPAYEGDPEKPKVVPKDQWYVSPAKPIQALANVG